MKRWSANEVALVGEVECDLAGEATLISGSGLWPPRLALADCSCASFVCSRVHATIRPAAYVAHNHASLVSNAAPRVGCRPALPSSESLHHRDALPTAPGRRDCECLLRDARRAGSSPTNIWPLQCYDVRARGPRHRTEGARHPRRFSSSATVIDAIIVYNCPAARRAPIDVASETPGDATTYSGSL